jgi:N-glycosylase/DNA lyase
MRQFVRTDIDQLLHRIRRDFENFYSNISQQMIEYYQTKTNELQTNINQILQHQQNEFQQYKLIQNKLQRENERLETDLNYEKEMFINLQSTLCK